MLSFFFGEAVVRSEPAAMLLVQRNADRWVITNAEPIAQIEVMISFDAWVWDGVSIRKEECREECLILESAS